MQCSPDCNLEATLKVRNQILIVHVNDCQVQLLNKVVLFNDHVALNDAIQCNQDDKVGVQDVASKL